MLNVIQFLQQHWEDINVWINAYATVFTFAQIMARFCASDLSISEVAKAWSEVIRLQKRLLDGVLDGPRRHFDDV